MNARRIVILLLCTIVSSALPCVGAHAHADEAPLPPVAQSFNLPGLLTTYTMPCATQATLRSAAMKDDYFGPPPQGFAADGRFVIYSPHLKAGQRQQAEKLFASVPDHVRAIAYRGGAIYVFPRKGIVEAVPELAVETDYFGDTGLYMAVARRLFVPFERGEGLTKQPDGTYKARSFAPSQREPFRIVNHESGHMVDDIMGAYSISAYGDNGDKRLSNRPDFREALESDLRRLTAADSPLPQKEITRLGYYLPATFEGKKIGGMRDTPDRARREVFAELWAQAQGYDSNRLSEAYPESFRVVSTLNDFFKALYGRSTHHCTYTEDGHAMPVTDEAAHAPTP